MRSFAFFFARPRHYFLFLQLQDCQTWNSWCSVSKTFVTCYYITNIPCVAYFYCCQNCMDLNYKPQFALLLALVFCLFNRDDLLIHGGSVRWTLTANCLVNERRWNVNWSRCSRCSHFKFAFYSRFEPSYSVLTAITASKATSTTQPGGLFGEKVEAMETNLAKLYYCIKNFQ